MERVDLIDLQKRADDLAERLPDADRDTVRELRSAVGELFELRVRLRGLAGD